MDNLQDIIVSILKKNKNNTDLVAVSFDIAQLIDQNYIPLKEAEQLQKGIEHYYTDNLITSRALENLIKQFPCSDIDSEINNAELDSLDPLHLSCIDRDCDACREWFLHHIEDEAYKELRKEFTRGKK